MDKNKVQAIRQKVNEALKMFEGEGLHVTVGRATYTADQVRFSIEITEVDKGETAEGKLFKQHAELFGFKPEDLFRQFTFRGREYIIVGMKAKARKNSIMIEDVHTKERFTMQPGVVKLSF